MAGIEGGDQTAVHFEAGTSELSLKEEWWGLGKSLPPNRAVVIREGGVAKSVVRVFFRDALLRRDHRQPIASIKVAGIGWVFTREDCRGRGLGHDCMKHAHRWLAEDMGIPAAFLYCRRQRGLYDALGYRTIREVGDKRLMAMSLVAGLRIEEGPWTLSPEDPF